MCCRDIRVLKLEEHDVPDRLKWRKGMMGNRLTRASMDTTNIKSLIYVTLSVHEPYFNAVRPHF
jgi:hypothetical protein